MEILDRAVRRNRVIARRSPASDTMFILTKLYLSFSCERHGAASLRIDVKEKVFFPIRCVDCSVCDYCYVFSFSFFFFDSVYLPLASRV
jgi:hypothetical protein